MIGEDYHEHFPSNLSAEAGEKENKTGA